STPSRTSLLCVLMLRRPPPPTLFPYTTLFRSNGVPATANRWLMTDVLRSQWGFDGFVVTDYTAINELIDHGLGDLQEVSARSLRSEEHTSELQSRENLVCRLLLEKKKKNKKKA